MYKNYCGNIANEIHVGVYNFRDEVRCRSWSVTLNICFVEVDSRMLRTGVLRQWEARDQQLLVYLW